MTQWEYRGVNAQSNLGQEYIDMLNRLGAEGWEVVGFAGTDKTVGFNALVTVLKRECVAPSSPERLEPDWYDDPTGRFDKRYWDGRQWSVHVGTTGPPKKTGLDSPTMLELTKL